MFLSAIGETTPWKFIKDSANLYDSINEEGLLDRNRTIEECNEAFTEVYNTLLAKTYLRNCLMF